MQIITTNSVTNWMDFYFTLTGLIEKNSITCCSQPWSRDSNLCRTDSDRIPPLFWFSSESSLKWSSSLKCSIKEWWGELWVINRRQSVPWKSYIDKSRHIYKRKESMLETLMYELLPLKIHITKLFPEKCFQVKINVYLYLFTR